MGFFTWFHRRENFTVEKRLDALETACRKLYQAKRDTVDALNNLQEQIIQLEQFDPPRRKKKRHAR